MEPQLSVLSNFSLNQSARTTNIEIIEPSDNDADEDVESTLVPSAVSFIGGSLDGSLHCEIEDLLKALPCWVKPHMVYPQHSIKKQRLLGHGQYGTVYKGTYEYGRAV